MVESSSQEMFKNHEDVAWGDMISRHGGVGLTVVLKALSGLFQPYFMILWFYKLSLHNSPQKIVKKQQQKQKQKENAQPLHKLLVELK